MKKAIYAALLLGGILVSCSSNESWTEEHEKEFVSNCETSFVSGFESTIGENISMVDRDELDKLASRYCSCAFESIKEKHDSPEEALKLSTEKLMEDAEECTPTDEDIENLLK